MPTFPIVLAHGIARFDILREILRGKLNLPDDNLAEHFQYFKRIKPHLEANGFTVSHPNQAFAGSVAHRAEQLRDRVNEVIQSSGSPKVHIIAHSMGGLDARHMIVDSGMAERVATLTTIGTPHHGSPVADKLEQTPASLLLQVLDRVLDVDGVADLTSSACEQFNRRAESSEARNGVIYQTYSAWENVTDVFTPLIASWTLVHAKEGQNDGLVSLRSQKWTRELLGEDGTRKPVQQFDFPFQADHLNEVGWWDPEEVINPLFGGGSIVKQALNYEERVRDLYLQIARNLPAVG
jgi:triacylglycerol lipase